MLDIILKILAILGVILLVLLGVALVAILLVLFFPISYRISGQKNTQRLSVNAKIFWLFGLLRLNYCYPEPGNIVVKLLCFTLYDSKKAESKATEQKADDTKKSTKEPVQKGAKQENTEATAPVSEKEHNNLDAGNLPPPGEGNEHEAGDENEGCDENESGSKTGFKERIIAKYEKLRYTILKIYDKIKHILAEINFYKELWDKPDTQELLKHALFRLKRIWKNIRPRKLKGDILFGAASPDTTGYVFAIYGMVLPQLGNHINVTPDFTQAILEGDLYIAGRITIFQLLYHSLKVALDKRLKRLIQIIKKHNKKQNKQK